MALEANGPAPYTTAAAAIAAIDAYRDRGLGAPITSEVLTRAGVPETIARRTLSSLKLLDLIQGDGQPSSQFEDLRLAQGDEEFRTRLQAWLRAVYADVLQYADPATHSLQRVTEAFRSYEPAGQRKSMAALLVGLWKYAGLPVASEPTPQSPRPQRARQTTPPRRKLSNTTPKTTLAAATPGGLPPGLVGLLQQIPTDGRGWTKETRDTFLAAFTAVLDFTIPTVSAADLASVVGDEPEEEVTI